MRTTLTSRWLVVGTPPQTVSSRYEHLDTSLVKGEMNFLFLLAGSDGVFAGIKHAFHALALDECRGPFTPRLWYLPDDPEVAKCMYTSRLITTPLILL
jgi:hypothetical protein